MSLSLRLSPEKRQQLFYIFIVLIFALTITSGIFAKNGWFPSTDALTGKRTGWFSKPLAKNAPSAWNPVPTSTPPPLSKEYIYAGSRLLSVVDSNAQELPPADLAIWRPTSGYWWVMTGSATGSYSNNFAVGFGMNGDTPEPGDYDGDGKTDFAIYRPSTGVWWINESSSGSTYSFSFGNSNSNDKPVPGDYDGDGRTDAAVFRQDDPATGNGKFYIRRYDGSYYTAHFGISSDTAASGDFDGDGKADVAVWRSSNNTFYSLNSSNAATSSFTFTVSGSEPVPADYDGDGRADYAVRQGSNWVIRNSGTSTTDTISWQSSSDVAVQNDYDGDGQCDIAVWRDSTGYWYIRPSANPATTRAVQWGSPSDIPEPAYFRR